MGQHKPVFQQQQADQHLFVHSHKFSTFLRAVEANSKCPPCFRSILLRLGEDQYSRKVCALATEGYPISGKSMVSWGHCLTSEARWGHSLSATPGSSWEVKFEVSRAPCMLAWSHHSDAAHPSRSLSSTAAPRNSQWHEGLYWNLLQSAGTSPNFFPSA